VKRPENIEALLVDYIEGTLNSDDFLLVEAWLKEHPEDAEVLGDWDSLSLMKDEKEIEGSTATIPENFDWNGLMLKELEGENSKEDKELLLSSMQSNSSLKKEFKLFELTKLKADHSVQYPKKSELLKSTPIFQLKPQSWSRVAAAAVFVGVIGSYMIFNQDDLEDSRRYLARSESSTVVVAPKIQMSSLASLTEKKASESVEPEVFPEKEIKPLPFTIEPRTQRAGIREDLFFASLELRKPTISTSMEVDERNLLHRDFEPYSFAWIEFEEPEEESFLAGAFNAVKDRVLGGEDKLMPSRNDLKSFAETGLAKSKRFTLDFEDGKLVAMGLPKLSWENR